MGKRELVVAQVRDGNDWTIDTLSRKTGASRPYTGEILADMVSHGTIQFYEKKIKGHIKRIFYNSELRNERINAVSVNVEPRAYSLRRGMDKEKPIQDVTIESGSDRIELTGLGDFHIGSNECDYDYIRSEVERIKNRPDNYAVILGDVCEFVTAHSLGDIFQQKVDPSEQVELAEELLAPIAHKILFWTSGNHSRRIIKETGINISAKMAKDLNITHYDDFCYSYLNGKFKGGEKQEWRIVGFHGASGSTTMGGKINSLERPSKWIDFDLMLMGHVHAEISFHTLVHRWQKRPLDINVKRRHYMSIGGSLGWFGSYAARKAYPPSGMGFPKAVFYKDGNIVIHESKEPGAGA